MQTIHALFENLIRLGRWRGVHHMMTHHNLTLAPGLKNALLMTCVDNHMLDDFHDMLTKLAPFPDDVVCLAAAHLIHAQAWKHLATLLIGTDCNAAKEIVARTMPDVVHGTQPGETVMAFNLAELSSATLTADQLDALALKNLQLYLLPLALESPQRKRYLPSHAVFEQYLTAWLAGWPTANPGLNGTPDDPIMQIAEHLGRKLVPIEIREIANQICTRYADKDAERDALLHWLALRCDDQDTFEHVAQRVTDTRIFTDLTRHPLASRNLHLRILHLACIELTPFAATRQGVELNKLVSPDILDGMCRVLIARKQFAKAAGYLKLLKDDELAAAAPLRHQLAEALITDGALDLIGEYEATGLIPELTPMEHRVAILNGIAKAVDRADHHLLVIHVAKRILETNDTILIRTFMAADEIVQKHCLHAGSSGWYEDVKTLARALPALA